MKLKEMLVSAEIKSVKKYLLILVQTVVLGIVCGVIGSSFHHAVEGVTSLRATYPWILYFLPAAGLIIAFLYKISGQDKYAGTDYVLSAVRENKNVPIAMLPVIFVSSVLTHLCGGSAGREGAALQLGGSAGSFMSGLFRNKQEEGSILIMCGMGGVFSALFGTPLAAATFALEVAVVGKYNLLVLAPSLVSSFIAYGVSILLNSEAVSFEVSFPSVDPIVMIEAIALALLATGVSIAFSSLIHYTHSIVPRLLKNSYIRGAVGGTAIVIMTLLAGSQKYNGAGMVSIEAAMEGEAQWYDFLLKMLFTAVTVAVGFKGGEIVPAFFIGSTFGCVAGGLMGLPAGMSSAIGLVAVFCGCVNCPLASLFLGLELFGGASLPYVAVAVAISYAITAKRFSLYNRF